MNSSNSSSDDEISMYTNAASKLKELNNKSKLNPLKTENGNNDNIDLDDDNDNSESISDSSLSGSKTKEKVKGLSNNKLCSTESDLSSDSSKKKESSKMDEDPVIVLDDDDDDDDFNVSTRLSTRSGRKRRATRNSKKKKTITNKVIDKIGVDDSFENLLDDSYDNSFQLSQENNDNYIVIGSPPPEKKSNDDYEVNVKVLWKSNKMERFEVRRHETFQKIFMYFSKLEGVPEDQIRITKKDKRINPLDTPISVDWSILDIFEGGVVSAEVAKKKHNNVAQGSEAENTCKIKIQTSEKGTLNITMKKTDSFNVLLQDCAEKLDVSASKIKFFFDGEQVDLDDTPEGLDLDDENCFDVKISE